MTHPAGPPPHGLYHADGHESLAHLAARCKTGVPHLLELVINAQPGGWGDSQREYVHAGNWHAPMPKGMRVDLP